MEYFYLQRRFSAILEEKMNMQKNFLRILWERVRFEQKKEWDSIAYSYLKDCDLILDAGCGEGRFILQNPKHIIGLDWNSESLKKAKERGCNVVEGDVRALPFPNESFSGIHCSHVIEHFLPLDVHKILKEFNRILRYNGVLVIRSPLLWDGFYSDLTHIKPYNPEAIIHYLVPSEQRTLDHISNDFDVINIKWRYKQLKSRIRYFNAMFNILNRWGFPWIKRNGYMLVMRKQRL